MKKIIGVLIATSLILASCFLQKESAPAEDTAESQPAAAEESSQVDEQSLATYPSAETTEIIQIKPAPTASMQAVSLEPRVINVESGNLFFKPSTIRVKANEKITIKFANKGVHTFTVKELGIDVNLNSASNSVTFIPAKKGTFQIICGILGHAAAGMVGQLIVE